mgnify:CR=1 FL=1
MESLRTLKLSKTEAVKPPSIPEEERRIPDIVETDTVDLEDVSLDITDPEERYSSHIIQPKRSVV